jgi:hypothetical protein
MEYPDQLRTPVRKPRPGIDALDDFLWEAASWDPAVEEFLEQARRVGADQGSAATARQLLDEQLVAEPAMVHRLVRLLAEAGELNPDQLPAACSGSPGPGSPGEARPGLGADPLGAALPLVGRETELFRGNRGATRRGAGVSVLCVTGPAGIGKTCLARAIVTAIGRRTPATDQLEVSLSRAAPGPGNHRLATTPHDALAQLLLQLGVREPDIPVSFAGRRARYAAELVDRRPVLVLDDVINESQVLPLLPPRQGSVVVTSRAPLTGLNDPRPDLLSLGPLAPTWSRQLVRQVFATYEIEADDRAANALYELCAGVPGPTILAARWLATAATTASPPVETLLERMAEARGGEALTVAVLGLLEEDQQAVMRALGLLQLPEADLRTMCLSTGLSQKRARAALDKLTNMGVVGPGECDQTWVADSLITGSVLLPVQPPDPDFERVLSPVVGLYGWRAETLRELISGLSAESSSSLWAWANERWRTERVNVSATLTAAAYSQEPALARGLAATSMDLADYGAEQPNGWRETGASVAAVVRIASDASDPDLQDRALRSLERLRRGRDGALAESAGKPIGVPDPIVVNWGTTPLAQVMEVVRRDLVERPGVPLLFGGRTGHDQ